MVVTDSTMDREGEEDETQANIEEEKQEQEEGCRSCCSIRCERKGNLRVSLLGLQGR